MPPRSPTRLRSETIGSHRVFDVQRHVVTDSSSDVGGSTYEVFSLRMPDWVTVAARTVDGSFLLIWQHRHGVDGLMLETPGGIQDDGERPEQTAARELLEETGYQAGRLESLDWVHPNPAIQDNRLHMQLALDCELTGPRKLDEHEDTEPVLIEAVELRRMLRAGEIRHALSALTLERALARLDGRSSE